MAAAAAAPARPRIREVQHIGFDLREAACRVIDVRKHPDDTCSVSSAYNISKSMQTKGCIWK